MKQPQQPQILMILNECLVKCREPSFKEGEVLKKLNFQNSRKNAEKIKQHHDSKDIIPKGISKRRFGKWSFKLNCRLILNIFKKLRVAIIGPGGCGKSAIAVRILSRRYINEYCSTLEDTYHRILSIDGVKVGQYRTKLQIDKKFLDFAGCHGHK